MVRWMVSAQATARCRSRLPMWPGMFSQPSSSFYSDVGGVEEVSVSVLRSCADSLVEEEASSLSLSAESGVSTHGWPLHMSSAGNSALSASTLEM